MVNRLSLLLMVIQEIDSQTAIKIVDMAGNLKQQANKQAKSSQLIRKESLGTITDEEKIILDGLDELFVTVETLIAGGNDKEAQIMACGTIEEFKDKCIELEI